MSSVTEATAAEQGAAMIATDEPTTEDVRAARELPRDVIGRAVAGWHEAATRLARARELADLEPTLRPWVVLESAAAHAAERQLRLVIATATALAGFPAARGITVEGTTYLAEPIRWPGDDQPDATRLVVVERADHLDAVRAFHPDRMPPTMPADPTDRPLWLVRALAWADTLGEAETWSRLHGVRSREPQEGWRNILAGQLRELGRGESLRRLGLDSAEP